MTSSDVNTMLGDSQLEADKPGLTSQVISPPTPQVRRGLDGFPELTLHENW